MSWRAWLQRNHSASRGVWLVYWRKETRKPSVDYEASVEEALCFGWIDGLSRTIDERRYARRFTPRTAKSAWSASNLARARRLVDQGRMAKAGLALARPALESAKQQPPPEKKPVSLRLPPDLRKALDASPVARRNFDMFAPGYRRRYLAWIADAKRPETRARRIREAVGLIARNVKALMK